MRNKIYFAKSYIVTQMVKFNIISITKKIGTVTLSKIYNSKYCRSTCASDSQSGEVQNIYCAS